MLARATATLSLLFAARSQPLPVRPEAVLNLSHGVYTLKNVKSGKYLNVIGGSTQDGAHVQIWSNPDSPHSQWDISHVVDYGQLSLPYFLGVPGVYHVTNVYSDKSLGVVPGTTRDEADVVQWADTSMRSQWMIQLVGCGPSCVALQDALSGKWLNVVGGGTNDGSKVWQFHSNLQNDSWWILEAPPCLPVGAECNVASNRCCKEGGGNFSQMTCAYGHDSPATCYDTTKCTTHVCDILSCCAGWECQSIGPISVCREPELHV